MKQSNVPFLFSKAQNAKMTWLFRWAPLTVFVGVVFALGEVVMGMFRVNDRWWAEGLIFLAVYTLLLPGYDALVRRHTKAGP